ncbi:acyltransferase [Stenotrophomonas lactitubi]|uniref:acyltransferase family protein n=1 Tax=Stenotrophomonas lactitubi TaxID=2045214 RepID=UPI00320A596D
MVKDAAADGLRGVASLAVFFAHFFLPFYPVAFEPCFSGVSASGAPSSYVDSLLSLPIISTVWNGSFAVSVFFVLSGYVLCKRYVDTGRESVVRSMASRRYLRLGLPIAASVMFAWAVGVSIPSVIDQVSAVTGSEWLKSNSLRDLVFGDAVQDAVYGVLLGGSSRFNTVYWTMRIELLGSFLVFGYALLSGSGRQAVLVAATFFIIIVGVNPPEWPHFLAFLIGAWIAQLGLKVSGLAGWSLIIAGLYLGGVSSNEIYDPLRHIGLNGAQAKWICSTVGAAMLFVAVRGGIGRSLLEARPAQFLGRISYSLYLIHVPVVIGVGCTAFWWAVSEASLTRSAAVGVALVVSLPLSLALSVAFERWVDRRAILWGKRLTSGVATADRSEPERDSARRS